MWQMDVFAAYEKVVFRTSYSSTNLALNNNWIAAGWHLLKDLVYGVLRDLVPFVQFKKRGNTHGGVLILVKLQALACN